MDGIERGARNNGPTRGVIGRGATANLDAGNGSEWKRYGTFPEQL
jgi:hypothetical protein